MSGLTRDVAEVLRSVAGVLQKIAEEIAGHGEVPRADQGVICGVTMVDKKLGGVFAALKLCCGGQSPCDSCWAHAARDALLDLFCIDTCHLRDESS